MVAIFDFPPAETPSPVVAGRLRRPITAEDAQRIVLGLLLQAADTGRGPDR